MAENCKTYTKYIPYWSPDPIFHTNHALFPVSDNRNSHITHYLGLATLFGAGIAGARSGIGATTFAVTKTLGATEGLLRYPNMVLTVCSMLPVPQLSLLTGVLEGGKQIYHPQPPKFPPKWQMQLEVYEGVSIPFAV